jgi:hypothetical protein
LAKIAREEKDPEGIGRRLKEMGVDDLVVNASEGLRVSADYHHYDLTQEEWKRLDDFIQKGTEAVFPEKFQGVYHILPAFKTAQVHETPDLITFFSQPVSRFVKNVQSRQWKDAENNLDEILKLYPYSEFWKEQKADFKKSVEALVPKN